MIVPFVEPQNKNKKPASYGLPLHGHCVWWDDEGKRTEAFLSSNAADPDANGVPVKNEVRLQRNSIMFVTLGPTINLPYFIAARFNLRVKWIYAGILVGTGPLVDPGFSGALTCPIHNLTDDDYTLTADDGAFAWIEFTKMPASAAPSTVLSESVRRYSSRSLDDLLVDANRGNPIRSSIPTEFRKSASEARAASEAAKDAQKSTTTARNFTVAASIGVLIALFALSATFYNGIQSLSAQNHALSVTGNRTYEDDRSRLNAKVAELQAKIKGDEAKFESVSAAVHRHFAF